MFKKTNEHGDYATIKRIKKLAELVEGKNVLDIGSREGLLKNFLPPETKYYGLEKTDFTNFPVNPFIKTLAEGILDPDVFKIFGDLKFETIVLAETLEHLLDPLQALKNIKFLLKKKGKIIGSVPNGLGWRYFFFLELIGDGMNDFSVPKWDGSEHFFTFNKLVLKALLMRAGFEVITVKEWGNWIPRTRLFLPFNLRGSHLIFEGRAV